MTNSAGTYENPPCEEHGWSHPFNECPTMHYTAGEKPMTACGLVWSGQVEAVGDVDLDLVNCRQCLMELRRETAEAELERAGWSDGYVRRVATRIDAVEDELEPAGEQLLIRDEPIEGEWARLAKLAQPFAVSSPVVAIDQLTELIEEAERVRAREVAKARAMECSWTSIGLALGVSKQAAAQRYGKKD